MASDEQLRITIRVSRWSLLLMRAWIWFCLRSLRGIGWLVAKTMKVTPRA